MTATIQRRGTPPCRLHKGRRGDGQVDEHGVKVALGAGGESAVPVRSENSSRVSRPTASGHAAMVTVSVASLARVAHPPRWLRP